MTKYCNVSQFWHKYPHRELQLWGYFHIWFILLFKCFPFLCPLATRNHGHRCRSSVRTMAYRLGDTVSPQLAQWESSFPWSAAMATMTTTHSYRQARRLDGFLWQQTKRKNKVTYFNLMLFAAGKTSKTTNPESIPVREQVLSRTLIWMNRLSKKIASKATLFDWNEICQQCLVLLDHFFWY